ncbi:MAG TPA: metallophosphoesterase family protein [Chitinophagales bacterium]|nr:metallophosphoesterase family protein [Chitinophagales bacterium]
MKRIGIISDTHGFLDPAVFDFFKECDEVWHAGDFGSNVAESLQSFKPLKGVFGNIDSNTVRKNFPEELFFSCEEVKIVMIHIGGYPNHYQQGVKEKLQQLKPDLFITGHSHILKITRDASLNNMLHINPGAAGKAGLHQVRTIVRLKIEGKKIFDVEVIELGKR